MPQVSTHVLKNGVTGGIRGGPSVLRDKAALQRALGHNNDAVPLIIHLLFDELQ